MWGHIVLLGLLDAGGLPPIVIDNKISYDVMAGLVIRTPVKTFTNKFTYDVDTGTFIRRLNDNVTITL